MKNQLLLFLIAITSVLSVNAQAPNYVDWEWDILKAGFAAPVGSTGVGTGLAWGTELRYNLKDDLSIGLQIEGAAFGNDFDEGADIGVSGSFSITGDKYLRTDSNTRPFVGLGIGSYSSGEITITSGSNSDVIGAVNSFGLAPRIGYELGHGRLMAQYNHTFKDGSANYFSVSLALTLWGGYKPG